jgi:uncharacterized protein YwgA
MTPEKLILLILDENGGRINGRTLLQKRAYFVSCLLKQDLGYRAHYYGPYSSEIDQSLAKLKATGFVKESVQEYDVSRYDYSLTDDGRLIVERLKSTESEANRFSNIASKIRQTGIADKYIKLSIAAKTHYIINAKKIHGVIEIQKAAKELGWTIPEPEILEAKKFIETLGC